MKKSIRDRAVTSAIASLEALKQKIIDLHYGIATGDPMPYKDVASFLSKTSSPELVLQFASSHKESDDCVEFSVDDIKSLEAEALRDLSRPFRRRQAD